MRLRRRLWQESKKSDGFGALAFPAYECRSNAWKGFLAFEPRKHRSVQKQTLRLDLNLQCCFRSEIMKSDRAILDLLRGPVWRQTLRSGDLVSAHASICCVSKVRKTNDGKVRVAEVGASRS